MEVATVVFGQHHHSVLATAAWNRDRDSQTYQQWSMISEQPRYLLLACHLGKRLQISVMELHVWQSAA